MDKRKLRITKTDGDRITEAIAELKWLYQKTKQYESTQGYLENCVDRLGVIKVWYAAHPGPILKGFKLPYTSKDIERTFSDAKMIYTYARKPKATKDPADSHWETPVKVFDLLIERAKWLEEK